MSLKKWGGGVYKKVSMGFGLYVHLRLILQDGNEDLVIFENMSSFPYSGYEGILDG